MMQFKKVICSAAVISVCALGSLANADLLLRDWHVIGPFGDSDAADVIFATAYPPEEAVDLQAGYAGKGGRKITWQSVEPAMIGNGHAHIDFRRYCGRWTRDACAYATATVEVDEDRTAMALVGSDDTITLWINGEKVLSQDVYRGAKPGQDKAEVSLKKGTNRILAKVCQASGGWELYLRLTGPSAEQREARYTLENEAVRLRFDYLGRLVELYNKTMDVHCIRQEPGSEPRAAFLLETYSANQPIYIDDPLLKGSGGFNFADPELLYNTAPREGDEKGDLQLEGIPSYEVPEIRVETDGDDQVLSCRYTFFGGLQAESRVRLPAEGGASYWTIHVANTADVLPAEHRRVYRTAFPILENLTVGVDPEQNFLARTYVQGELIPNPSAYDFMRPGRPGARINSLSYPGWASMPWMDLYAPAGETEKDEIAGVYVASYDPAFQQLSLEAVPNAEEQTMTLALRTLSFLEPEEEWTSQTFVVAVHEGDWHWAANRYRQDSAAWLKQRDVPEWIKTTHGWFGSGNPNYRYEQFPDMLEAARWLGLNYLQIWAQMLENVGPDKQRKAYYCFFLPDPDRGGEKDMEQGVKAVREAGGHIGFYSNFWTFDADIHNCLQQWKDQIPEDVAIPKWTNGFKNYAFVFPDGHTEAGNYYQGYAGMCPGAEGWRDYLSFWIGDKYVRQYGVDAWYLDSFPVTMFGADTVCFSPHHGQTRPHGVGAALLQFARELREKTDDAGPVAVTSETANDCFMQYNSHALGLELIDGLSRYPRPEIYTYTFPDHYIFTGSCNGCGSGLKYYYEGLESYTRPMAWNRVFLMGYRFDILGWGYNRANHDFQYLKKLIALRDLTADTWYHSSFRDGDGLSFLPDQVEVKAFRGNDGRTVTLAVLDRRPGKAAFQLRLYPDRLDVPMMTEAELHTLDGQRQTVELEKGTDGELRLLIPPRADPPAVVVLRADIGAGER